MKCFFTFQWWGILWGLWQKGRICSQSTLMARANLTLSSELEQKFKDAQSADDSTRFLKVLIEGETLICAEQVSCTDTAAADFDNILPPCINEEACIILYCLTDVQKDFFNPGANLSLGHGADAKSWALICWIPESCPVRSKMLYSSSREDLKKSLGRSLFEQEYGANHIEEMNWKSYSDFTDPTHAKDLYQSEKERLLKEEVTASQAEITSHGGQKSNAMGLLPFILNEKVHAAVTTLNANKDTSVVIIELYIGGEVVSLTSDEATASSAEGKGCGCIVHSPTSGSDYSFVDRISATEGRFYIIHIPIGSICINNIAVQGTFFVFSCPDGTPVRSRMMLSSAKATVLHRLTEEAGLVFTKNFEIRDPGDIDDSISDACVDKAAAGGNGVGGEGSLVSVELHAKPAFPGGAGGRGARGGARRPVAKFVADA